jgi:hypothetical protein
LPFVVALDLGLFVLPAHAYAAIGGNGLSSSFAINASRAGVNISPDTSVLPATTVASV